jgi:hypothetical protein
VRKLAEVLETQQHFLVHPPILNATGEALRALLQTMRDQVGPDDRVFFYFAGHGIADDGEEGPAGYIVPVDADPNNVKSTCLPMADLQNALGQLPCRHLLLVLDCCFSGAFRWSSRFRAIGSVLPKRIYKERFDRFVQDRAWQVITSAAHDQKALDVLDGKPTGDRGWRQTGDQTAHSPFAQALFEGLAGAADIKGDRESDGMITATELYAYIRNQVEPRTIQAGQQLRQTPGFFPLKQHDKGEFIFLHPRHRLNLPPTPNRSPYRGLASFAEEDRELFYGRDRVIRELYEKAQSSKLLVLTGPSGTGKSSVIQAGLLPMLRKDGHRILPAVRPGVHPVTALEAALPAATDGQRTIVLIDQLEELVTRCLDPHEREQFNARLHELLQHDDYHLIVTVRSDFEAQLVSAPLRDAWAAGRCTVPAFTFDELKEAIVLPAAQEVLLIDPPTLIDEIMADVVQSPGALPLLSFALNEWYEAYRQSGREDRTLGQGDYERIGGVRGALRAKADQLYHQLTPEEQRTIRRILLRVVSVEGDLASKRVPMSDLDFSAAEAPLVASIVEKLIDARLVVKGDDYLEPAHDMLVRGWSTLRDWIQEVGRDKLILGAKLTAAANDFARTGDTGLLWDNNPFLPVVARELERPQPWFNAAESRFVRESVQRREDKARAAEQEKVRVLLSLFASLDLHLTNGQPGSVVLSGTDWIRISRLPDDLPAFRPPAASRDFIVARHYGAGRLLVYAHDGLTLDGEIRPSSDNLLFAENALRWLAPNAAPASADGGLKVLFWEGTYHRIENMSKVREFIQRRQWSIEVTSPETLADDLTGAGILWYASDWFPPEDFATRHVPLIEEFVRAGGGLLVGGLGWSYWLYTDRHPEGPYAADELGLPFGFAFTDDAFDYDASQPIPLLPGR